MRLRRFALTCAVALRICGGQTDPPVDAPELARRGPLAVGVRTVEIVHPGQVDIVHFDQSAGKAPLYGRPLTLEIWYPAAIANRGEERTAYELAPPANVRGAAPATPAAFQITGRALRDAPPLRDKPFPLVVVSHGFPGSRHFLADLAENLASKGYVVAAIDHTDSVFGAQRGFSSTLLNRAADQLFTIGAIAEMAKQPGHFLSGVADVSRTAIVGYSMGGYGALAAAGAGYSRQAMAARVVPGGYFNDWIAGSEKYRARLRPEVKAIVAIAPWGAQPPYNSWDSEGLAGLRVPMLVIAGDQDDISDFEHGIKTVFDRAVNSERCMLVYENARHNVGALLPPAEVLASFAARDFYDEPVWRKDRIRAINQHFVTAFLELYLKGDESRRAWLHVRPEKSNDGKWPQPPAGEPLGAKFSDGAAYWKGFQRRWAVGLEMHCATAR